MKTAFIVLSLICIVLAVALYRRHSGALQAGEAAAKAQQSLSNEVAELRTKLALATSDSAVVQSNQQRVIERHLSELAATSNRFVQANLQLAAAQQEARAAQTELQTKMAAIALLEAQRDESGRRLEAASALQKELAETKQKLAQSLGESGTLEQALGRLRVEKADLESKIEDPVFLRLQAKKVADQAALRRRLASARRIDASDPRVRLELQQDGSVHPVIPGNSEDKK
ncbi:MAG: hypothetical protein AAB676_04030 [Verrucomicrobiota bacterium]